MIKVKIIKYVGAYVPDQIVEVDEKLAEQLCHVNVHEGVVHQRAIRLSDVKEIPVNVDDLTVGEAAELGIKNIASAPVTETKAEEKKKK